MTEPVENELMTTDPETPRPSPANPLAGWLLPILLFGLTSVSTLYAGGSMLGPVEDGSSLLAGWTFALPLMAILLSHELGHYFAGIKHGADVSPPYFIPMPFFLLGTLGAVIKMRSPIRTRAELLDVGAAGPLAGFVVALPVLIYGIHESSIQALDPAQQYLVEGRGLLYMGLIMLVKGPIPPGHDIMLTPTAFAGWAGLLVTMINLLPYGQLDGGHVAHALWGERQQRYGRLVLKALPWLALGIGLNASLQSHLRGAPWQMALTELFNGLNWLVWWFVLKLLHRGGRASHPPMHPAPLDQGRRRVAIGTLLLFILLFMPEWLKVQGGEAVSW